MFDLTDEMHQLAADAASAARPMAVTEVMRRGNHRRTRMIAQRSIGGLSAIALGAAVFTGVTHQAGGNPAASGAAAHGDTVAVTQSGAAGQLTLQVKYQVLRGGKFKLLSVTYSGESHQKLTKKSEVLAWFGPGLNPPAKPGAIAAFFIPLHPSSPHNFSGSLSAKTIRFVNKGNSLGHNGSITVTLEPSDVVPWQPVPNKAGSPTHIKPSKVVTRNLKAIAVLSH